MNSIQNNIVNDKQVKKFGFYGFFKNLTFFEPYLLVYLLGLDYNLFQIGLLFSVREIITTLFEVPSGILADHYGKKTELIICFLFYIISFVLFFLGINFLIILIAMIFYGFGDAFRSGTHKAMIYSYLEQKNWFSEKTFTYGRTRSYSMIGSSTSAFTSIILVILFKDLSWIFLLSIIPYIANFILILSYPNSLNERKVSTISIKKFYQLTISQIKDIIKIPKLKSILISSSLFDGIFKTTKDYIQPVIIISIASLGISFLKFDEETNKKIILGFIYGIFYFLSSKASKNVYKLNKLANSKKLMNLFFDGLGFLLLMIFVFLKLELLFPIIIVYLILYLLKNARRPLLVDVAGDIMDKKDRATILSIDSQLKALFVIILAPLFGFIATEFSIEFAFLCFAIGIVIINFWLRTKIR